MTQIRMPAGAGAARVSSGERFLACSEDARQGVCAPGGGTQEVPLNLNSSKAAEECSAASSSSAYTWPVHLGPLISRLHRGSELYQARNNSAGGGMSCEDRREGRESEPGGAGGREDGGGALYRDQTAPLLQARRYSVEYSSIMRVNL